jgi:gamma-glutamyltranspeptidase/glutathione hydrolase
MLSLTDYQKAKPVKRMHYIAEAMRRAYRDRAEFLGDSDHVKVPMARLTSMSHARLLWKTFNPDKATDSDDLPEVPVKAKVSMHTTHFSIIDKDGNMVAATLSINYPFGSCFVPPGTGVLLNDEMDDFSSKPGTPNVYGLIGTYANAIAPGKRPLSSMSPTFVFDRNRVGVIGTPGGSRIITMVALGVMEFERGANARQIVSLKRFHHQYRPDHIQLEPKALTQDQKDALVFMGHELKQLKSPYGNMQVIIWNKNSGQVDAASDARGIGKAQIRKK